MLMVLATFCFHANDAELQSNGRLLLVLAVLLTASTEENSWTRTEMMQRITLILIVLLATGMDKHKPMKRAVAIHAVNYQMDQRNSTYPLPPLMQDIFHCHR